MSTYKTFGMHLVFVAAFMISGQAIAQKVRPATGKIPSSYKAGPDGKYTQEQLDEMLQKGILTPEQRLYVMKQQAAGNVVGPAIATSTTKPQNGTITLREESPRTKKRRGNRDGGRKKRVSLGSKLAKAKQGPVKRLGAAIDKLVKSGNLANADLVVTLKEELAQLKKKQNNGTDISGKLPEVEKWEEIVETVLAKQESGDCVNGNCARIANSAIERSDSADDVAHAINLLGNLDRRGLSGLHFLNEAFEKHYKALAGTMSESKVEVAAGKAARKDAEAQLIAKFMEDGKLSEADAKKEAKKTLDDLCKGGGKKGGAVASSTHSGKNKSLRPDNGRQPCPLRFMVPGFCGNIAA